MAGHIVTAPLVIAKAQDGTDVYLYRGAGITGGLRAGEIARLKADGLIEAVPDPVPTPDEVAALLAESDRIAAEKAESDAAAAKATAPKTATK